MTLDDLDDSPMTSLKRSCEEDSPATSLKRSREEVEATAAEDQKLVDKRKEELMPTASLRGDSLQDVGSFGNALTSIESWQESIDKEMIAEKIKMVEETPYIARQLSSTLEGTKKLLVDDETLLGDSEVVELLTPFKKAYLSGEQSNKRRCDYLRVEVSNRLQNEAFRLLYKVNKAATTVEMQLSALSGLSEAGGTTTERSTRNQKSNNTALQRALVDREQARMCFADPQRSFSPVTNSCKGIGEVLPDLLRLADNNDANAKAAEEKLQIAAQGFTGFCRRPRFSGRNKT